MKISVFNLYEAVLLNQQVTNAVISSSCTWKNQNFELRLSFGDFLDAMSVKYTLNNNTFVLVRCIFA